MAADIVPFGNGDNRVKPRLKVVGVGGAGCNAVSGCGFESVGMYRSRDDVRNLSTHRRLMLTEEHFRFVKSTSPRLLSTLDHECPKNMKEIIGETDLIFVFTGLGGETGSFVTPGVAQICKRLSHLVIVSVVLPFSMEGIERRTLSSTALSNVADASHVTISYPNDGLLEVAPNLPLHKALKIMDEIMVDPPVRAQSGIVRGRSGRSKGRSGLRKTSPFWYGDRTSTGRCGQCRGRCFHLTLVRLRPIEGRFGDHGPVHDGPRYGIYEHGDKRGQRKGPQCEDQVCLADRPRSG